MSNNISRRKVTQGIAWSAPVIAATVAAPLAAASPSLCDTEDLWRNQTDFPSIIVGPGGVITFTKPANWRGTWPPDMGVSYIGTDARATIEVDGDKVIATPPADVDPFDIGSIRVSPSPWFHSYLERATDDDGNFVCALWVYDDGVL